MAPMNPGSLAGRIALVTGANDPAGLGHGIAQSLVADGATVYFGCRTAAQVKRLATEFDADPARRAIELDVADPAMIAAAFRRIEAEAGRLDLLVNNAGVGTNRAALEETAAEWDRIMIVNARGPFLCAQAAARLMRPRGFGRIVNVSSQAGSVAIVNHAAYASSKAALNMLTRSAALEWAPFGITVNAVAPTYLLTPGTRGSLEQPEFLRSVLSRIPAGRVGTIGDVAHVVRFLCQPESSLITGAIVPVDGGWTLP